MDKLTNDKFKDDSSTTQKTGNTSAVEHNSRTFRTGENYVNKARDSSKDVNQQLRRERCEDVSCSRTRRFRLHLIINGKDRIKELCDAHSAEYINQNARNKAVNFRDVEVLQ